MKITEIQIRPIKPKDGLVAFASVLFDDCLFLGSIGIHTKLDGFGYRLTYPTKKIGDRDMNIYHPTSKETSTAIEKEIIAKAEEILN
ncbi:MAG: septation protein SpoVG family protein [Candidatus Paceibacterota bacterium]